MTTIIISAVRFYKGIQGKTESEVHKVKRVSETKISRKISETVYTETDTDGDVEIEDNEEKLLPQINDYLNMGKQFDRMMFFYGAGVSQILAKLEILNREFQYSNDRNPIENIKSRVKSEQSIILKMKKKGLPLTISSVMNNIYDIAGVRVVCPFISDVYQVARMLLSQKDINLVKMKDYIKNPKPNGYRSLHLIVLVDVFFSEKMQQIPVEIQLRSIAMNCWASTEHQLRYKKDYEQTEEMQEELRICADMMAEVDRKMQKMAEKLEF